MAVPPSSVGTDHDTTAFPLVVVTEEMTGATGLPNGVTTPEATTVEFPPALVAKRLVVYSTPLVSPEIFALPLTGEAYVYTSAAEIVTTCTAPLVGVAINVYEVIGESETDTNQSTVARRDEELERASDGADGGPTGRATADASEVGLAPASLLATTLNLLQLLDALDQKQLHKKPPFEPLM